jgi:glutaredoxin
MKFEVFGKPACAKCKSTKAKLTHLVSKAEPGESVALAFFDLDTVEGRAEGAFNDVFDTLPAVILRAESGDVLARWDGVVPPSVEVQAFLTAAKGASIV